MQAVARDTAQAAPDASAVGASADTPATPREPQPPAFMRDVFVYVTAQPDSLTIGDRATLEVVVEAPLGVEVLFPPGNPLRTRRIDVRDFATRDPEKMQTNALQWVGLYEISVYAVGEVVLPPWPVQVRMGALEAIARSDSVRFFVGSVLDDSLAAAGIGDLKPQEEVPVPPPWRTWAIVGAFVVLVALMYWFWRSRRKEQVVQLPPPRPAHEVALTELRKLETLRLPFDGKIKQHYMILSEILRTYLENAPQFRIHALEETTHEILEELAARDFDEETVQRLAVLCEEADLVKFAKHKPTIDECSAALDATRSFVLDTSKTSALAQLHAEPAVAMVGGSAAAAPSATSAPASAGPSAASAPGRGNGAGSGDVPPPAPGGEERS